MPGPAEIDAAGQAAAALDPRVVEVLRRWWGFETLRPLQAEAIQTALAGRDSLVVMPTGGGKSLCYQLPPLVGESTDVVISPLVALMKDQVDSLEAIGYPAAALHSGLSAEERSAIRGRLRAGELRLLFTAPERLVNSGLLDTLAEVGVKRFAIDEAHCISQWGHDFRPEYRQLALLRERFPQASLHAFTATATPRVRDDITGQLGLRDPAVLVGTFDRPNLVYRVVPRTDRVAQTLAILGRHQGEASIVYCVSRRETEQLAAKLAAEGLLARPYHAGLAAKERHRTQDAFAKETIDVVVATVAFGMGIDRSDVRLVLHTALPKSLEAATGWRPSVSCSTRRPTSSSGRRSCGRAPPRANSTRRSRSGSSPRRCSTSTRCGGMPRRPAAGMPRSRSISGSRIPRSPARPATSAWARGRAWPTRLSRPKKSFPAWLE